MVTILVPVVHMFISPSSLGKQAEDIEKPVLPPHVGEEGVLLPFGSNAAVPWSVGSCSFLEKQAGFLISDVLCSPFLLITS